MTSAAASSTDGSALAIANLRVVVDSAHGLTSENATKGGDEMEVRAAVYCRASRDTQGLAKSVDRQLSDCREIAARKGWAIVAEFRDNNRSASHAKKRGRTDYRALLDGIENGDYDAVVVWMEDRLQRDVYDLAEFLKLCEANGVTKLASAGTEYDVSDPDQRMLLYMKGAIAQAELDKIAKRNRRIALERAEANGDNGGGKRPFGFQGRRRTKDASGNTIIVPGVTLLQALYEQDMIHEAAQRVIAGDSLRGISRDWTTRGVKGTTGERITPRSLRRMLLSPRIAGLVERNGELHTATWAPILDRAMWDAVRAILEDPARSAHLGGRPMTYMLVGFVYCGVCGNRLSGYRDRRNKLATRYVCTNRYGEGGKCVQRSTAPVDDLVERALFAAVESDQFYEMTSTDAADPTRELHAALDRDRGLLARLEDKVAEELISAPTAKRKRAEIERRMQTTRAKLDRLSDTRVHANLPTNLRDAWKDYTLDRKRAILAAVIRRIEIHPTGPGRRTFDPSAVRVDWKV